MGSDEVQSLVVPPGATGTYRLSYQNQTTTPLAATANDAAIEAALNALPALAPGGVRVSGVGTFTVRFVGTTVAGAPQPLLAVDSSGLLADGVASVTRLTAGSTPGPSRAIRFGSGASLTASNTRPSGGDRDAAPRLSALSTMTVAFGLQVNEIRGAAIGNSPIPIVVMEQYGECGFAIILQPDTPSPYDRLRVIARTRRDGSPSDNVGYYGHMGLHDGPLLGAIDPAPGERVHFVVRVDLTGGGLALTMFRNGQYYSAEGLNGSAPQYLYSEGAQLQLTIGVPSELTPGYPDGMRNILSIPGYPISRGGDASVTFDSFVIWDTALSDAEIANIANPNSDLDSFAPDHQIFRLDGRGAVDADVILGPGGNLVNRGAADLDMPRDGRIMWRDSAATLYDVPSTMGVAGRGGVQLAAQQGEVMQARVRVAKANKSGTIYVELEDNSGGDVNLANSNTYESLMRDVAPRIEVTVRRDGGAVESWNPWSIFAWPPTFGSDQPKGYMLLVPPRNMAPLRDGDTISLLTPDSWITSALGACAGIDSPLEVGSILPPISEIIPEGNRLKPGIGVALSDHGLPGVYADAIKHGAGWREGEHVPLTPDANGWPIRTSGQIANIILTLSGDGIVPDPYLTQAHLDPPYPIPGRAANRLLGAEGGEFEDLKPAYGTRTIPRKGKLYAILTPKPGRESEVDARWAFNNFAPFTTPGYSSSADQASGQPNPCFASFTDSSGVLIHPGTGKRYRVWSYECWDPQNNPAHIDKIGWKTVPRSHLHISEAVAEAEAYFVPDSDTEERIYTFDPFNPPLINPEFRSKMQGSAIEIMRVMTANNGNSTAACRSSDYVPENYSALIVGRDRENPWTTLIPIASVSIPTEAEVAAAAAFDRTPRSVYVKITTRVPHNLEHGSRFETRGNLMMGIPRAAGETGDTSGVIAYGNAMVLTPTTFLATVSAVRNTGGPVATSGIASGSTAETSVLRTLYPHFPLEHLGRLIGECNPNGKIWFNINPAFLQCDPFDTNGDGTMDGPWNELRLVAERIIGNLPPGVKLILEPGNEVWNYAAPYYYGVMHFNQVIHRNYGHGAVLRPRSYDGSGGITDFSIVTPGRGYFCGNVKIRSGAGTGFSGLLRTDPLTGAVTGVHVVTPGSGYGTPNTTLEGGDPSVEVSIGMGRGAVLTPVISGGQITSIAITNGGNGYYGGMLRIVGGSGSGATATFTVNGLGAINSITMHGLGSGYLPGDTTYVETPHSLAYGGEPWAGDDQKNVYLINMLLGSRAARIFRDVMVVHGRSADDVEIDIGIGPLDWIMPAVNVALDYTNRSGDPLNRIDAAGQHTYWTNSTPIGLPTSVASALTTEEDMDILEVEVSHSRILDQRVTAGFPKTYIYEGGLDCLTLIPLDVQGTNNDSAGLYRRLVRSFTPHYHPRMHGIELMFLRHMQNLGVDAYCVYEAFNTWRRAGVENTYMTSGTLGYFHSTWGRFNGGYGEMPGVGDGSDGKHDNRFETHGIAGANNPGVSVVPGMGAFKTWALGSLTSPTPIPTPTPTPIPTPTPTPIPTPTPTSPTPTSPTPTTPTPTPTPGDGPKPKYIPKVKKRSWHPWSSGQNSNSSNPWCPHSPRRPRRKGWPKSE